MANTPILGIPLPLQTTAPPDVVLWLGNGLGEVDTILGTGSKAIKVAKPGTTAQAPLRRDSVLYGSAAPPTLEVGQIYLQHQA